MVWAAQRDDPGNGAWHPPRRGIADQAAERMAEEIDRPLPCVALHLLDGGRHVLEDEVGHMARPARAEVSRAPVPPEVEVIDVEAGTGEVVDEAARGQVPDVAVLPIAVDEEERRERPFREGASLAHHCERYPGGAARDDDLLDEPVSFVA